MSSRSCHRVRFLPEPGEDVEVPSGTPLLEAAARAGLLIEAICGGKGTCGSCLMELTPATPEGEPVPGAEARLVSACSERVEGDLVAVPLGHRLGPKRRIVTGTSYLLQRAAQLAPEELRAICRRVALRVERPSIELAQSDAERLTRALTERGQVPALELDLTTLRQLPDTLRAADGEVTATLWDEGRHSTVLAVEPGDTSDQRLLGVACDLGTSTVVLRLLDLTTGAVLAHASDYNRQVRSGADVISRIDRASLADGLEQLRKQAVTSINVLLRRLSQQAAVPPEDLRAMVVAGNTTMLHLLLGVPPRYIREEPYVPAFASLPSRTAGELDLEMHPEGRVLPLPAVGAWVGGDITAGLLARERAGNKGDVFLFIDVGTNGEIVLGSDDWMLACACSAGPAFEGGGVRFGMRATDGAIERIELTADGQVRTMDVIGGGKPRGLCGSGLIQLLGELARCGLIDRRGRLADLPNHPRLTRFGRARAFIVVDRTQARGGRDILLAEPDIDNLVRAKGAIYSGASLLLRKLGLPFDAVDTVYIAGGFGRYIAVEQAIAIGMLPDLPPERFVFLGNSALAGATLTLLSRQQRDRAWDIARAMTYVELSAEPAYMDEYTGALFLPHTDMRLFPSVG